MNKNYTRNSNEPYSASGNAIANDLGPSAFVDQFVRTINADTNSLSTGTVAAVVPNTDNCFQISSTTTDFPRLYVGPPNTPNCWVVLNGCDFNPTITMVEQPEAEPVPTLSRWGFMATALALLAVATLLFRRRARLEAQ